MSKFIISLSGRPLIHGYRRREFIWDESRSRYVYKGKVFEEPEFNELVKEALTRYEEWRPLVEVVEISQPAAAVDLDEAPPVATISAAREISLEEAKAVVERLAPELLRKKTGPKPAPQAATG